MSNTGLIIEERSRDIGDFLVGRLIPFRKKRMVGPFIFIDHMGPSTIKPGHYMDIGQHPHIGLSTLTYLLEGQIMHRDTLGTEQLVTPGSVGFMTSGSGIVHTERTPPQLRDGGEYPVHGYQIWIALPKALQKMRPEFSYTAADNLPKWSDGSISYTLVAGEGYGQKSPVPVFSPLFMIEAKTTKTAVLDVKGQVKGEVGIVIVDGHIDACGQRIGKGNMLVSKEEDICKIVLGENTHVFLFGGEPFTEERFIYWNFVSTEKDLIEEAKQAWKEHKFEMVPGESGYIPLPEF